MVTVTLFTEPVKRAIVEGRHNLGGIVFTDIRCLITGEDRGVVAQRDPH